MPPNHQHSGELPDPVILLAVRAEIEGALHPMREEMRAGFKGMQERFASGDTRMALTEQRQATQEARCREHQINQALQPKTEKTKRELNPILAGVIQTALNVIVTAAVLWFLIGIGQQAAKGVP